MRRQVQSSTSSASKRASSVQFANRTHKESSTEKPVTRLKHKPERLNYQIYLDNIDVTPKPLHPPKIYISETSQHHGTKHDSIQLQEIIKQLHYETVRTESVGSGTISTNIQEEVYQPYTSDGDIENVEPKEETTAIEEELKVATPRNINIRLQETPMLFLLELPSQVEPKGTDSGIQVTKDNEEYEFLTKGKGANRKVLNAEAQTRKCIAKTKSTGMFGTHQRHDSAFASGWDMLDSKLLSENPIKIIPQSKVFSTVSSAEQYLHMMLNDVPIDETKQNKNQLLELQNLRSFQNAVLVVERLLDANVYQYQQSRIRGLYPPDPLKTSIFFNYRLDLLWSFRNEHVRNRAVTMITLNDSNEDIVAVGYGKFYFEDDVGVTGMVCVWNIKNPSQPERQYEFEIPVTGLKFSKGKPNLLGVIFYDGTLKILDIVGVKGACLAETTK